MLTTLVINIYICKKCILLFFRKLFSAIKYIARGVYNYTTVFHGESCIFTCQRTFFRGLFCIKSYWSQNKVLENKVSNWQDFISRDFLIKRLFSHRTFFQCERTCKIFPWYIQKDENRVLHVTGYCRLQSTAGYKVTPGYKGTAGYRVLQGTRALQGAGN